MSCCGMKPTPPTALPSTSMANDRSGLLARVRRMNDTPSLTVYGCGNRSRRFIQIFRLSALRTRDGTSSGSHERTTQLSRTSRIAPARPTVEPKRGEPADASAADTERCSRRTATGRLHADGQEEHPAPRNCERHRQILPGCGTWARTASPRRLLRLFPPEAKDGSRTEQQRKAQHHDCRGDCGAQAHSAPRHRIEPVHSPARGNHQG